MRRAAALLACALFACKGESAAAPSPAQAAKPDARAAWRAVVDAPDRSEADRKLDAGRRPAEMLEFLDLKPGMKVAEIGAGGGYTTELLARAVGPSGVVYMQNAPSWVQSFLKDALAERSTHAAMKNVVRVERDFDDPLPPEARNLDAVIINVIYHDVVNTKLNRMKMNRAVFNALQPGGTYVVIDSSAQAGSGVSATNTLHRIDEQVVRDEVQSAGFKLLGEGSFLRNPQDTRDWNSSPRAAAEKRGTSDRFALKFVRPEGAHAWPEPPRLRLPGGARPTRVTAELTVDPTQPQFEGREEIELVLDAPTNLLWLNADGLKILDSEPRASIVDAQPGFVGFQFDPPLPAGRTSLKIHWQGELSRTDFDGAFRQREQNEWYALTHLEPLGARRIWPSFDEPAFKVPWTLSLRVPKNAAAYFNTPPEKEEQSGEMRTVRFAETRPLPTYLLAFGVGPFERVDAGKMKSGAPVGIVVTHGKADWAKYSAQSSPALMNILEDYFAVPYHYSKLDLIEIPLGTGAMENPGLITFNQRINLVRPGQETPQFRRRAAGVEAHEFAHLWFGDMVTTAWWDDIWLNEAFATWMAFKAVERYQPSWNANAERVASANYAMAQDRLMTARRIRQPITSEGDIKTAFDGITYQKGAAVIAMFEQWIGAEKFRSGVQRYLREHADGNATAKEFLAAISADAGKDVAPAFSTFLDQPGLPLVAARLSCQGGKGRVELSQARYVPLGAQMPAQEQLWQMPVCVRSAAGHSCTLLTEKTGAIELSSCPDWIEPNAGASGYYRTALDESSLLSLGKNLAKLSVPEKMMLFQDALAAARLGTVELGRVLELVPAMAQDKDRHVVQTAASVLEFLRDEGFVPDELRPRFAAFVRENFAKRAASLGFKARKGEDEDAAFLRPTLLALVGDVGEDPGIRAEAKQAALRWLDDHSSLTPELAATALHLSAIEGDRSLFDRLQQAAKGEKLRVDRQRILDAMGSFRDPAIASQAMPIALSDEFDARESIALLMNAAHQPPTRDLALQFLEKNFDTLVSRMPRDWGAGAVTVAAGFCDQQHLADVESFFGPRASRFPGGERRFAQTAENIRQCSAFRSRASPSVVAFLNRQPERHATR
ncbi:MAG: M1 family peptidase [Deltaproteobacteria bacterium]|nr:MAG: M1 family peptidase [Deltaproteobacteria bacterium]